MARPTLPVAPYIEKLAEAVLLGATYELAARYAGISAKTFERWRKAMPTATTGPLVALRERLQQAEGQAAVRWLAQIAQAAQHGEWRAAAFMLERRYPEAYGPGVAKVAPVGPDGEPLPLRVIYLPDKAPTPEQWAENVKHLDYGANGQHRPEPQP
jgi:transposase